MLTATTTARRAGDSLASTAPQTRRGLRRIAAATGLLVASAVLVALGAAPAYASDASSIVSKTNSTRSSHGLTSYSVRSDLNSVALAQAKRMASSGKLFHNPNLSSDVSGWRYVGENVGYGPSIDKIYTALMNSAPHRANILDTDYTQIGVGAVRDDNGRIWIAQVFRKPMSSSTSTTAKKSAKPKRVVGTSTRSSNAKAAPKAKPRASVKAAPAPKPTPKPVAQAPAPSPSPTFAQRVADLEQQGGAQTQGDPVSDSIDFAQAMATLGS